MPEFSASPLVNKLEDNLFSVLEKLAAMGWPAHVWGNNAANSPPFTR